MAQKLLVLPGVGEVVLVKRRGAKNMRLSLTPAGKVRVSLPLWAPYAAGIAFARSRADWIVSNKTLHAQTELKHGDKIGAGHQINLVEVPTGRTLSMRITSPNVFIYAPRGIDASRLQAKINQAAESALKKEALQLLPPRLSLLSITHRLPYSGLQIRKLTSRWGSCSSKKKITLSIFLVQLPSNLMDYVLIHELLHTKYQHHGPDFWNAFEQILPDAKKMRREIHKFRPVVYAQ